ncbi:ZIP family metal transporter [Elusimicrobiota bacterium]
MIELNPILMSSAAASTAILAGVFYRIHSWSHKSLWRILSFGSAILLASGFNLLIPSQGKITLIGALIGFTLFFVMENYIIIHSCPHHLTDCQVHSLGVMACVSLLIHSLFDGAILGTSFKVGPLEFKSVLLGMAIHKLMDSLMLLALFKTEFSWGFNKSLAVVLAIAATMPLGTILALFFIRQSGSAAIPLLAGISAGGLIYLAASDILPRIHRLKDPVSIVCFLAGLASVGLMIHCH